MKKKIEFHGMESSQVLEAHANEKLEKVINLVKKNEEKEPSPLIVELWLKAQKLHPNHRAELHVKTPRFDLHAHDDGTDLYVVLDNTIDKMVKLLKKAKSKAKTKEKHPKNEKLDFESDKYTL